MNESGEKKNDILMTHHCTTNWRYIKTISQALSRAPLELKLFFLTEGGVNRIVVTIDIYIRSLDMIFER